jgi:hypothetical protein
MFLSTDNAGFLGSYGCLFPDGYGLSKLQVRISVRGIRNGFFAGVLAMTSKRTFDSLDTYTHHQVFFVSFYQFVIQLGWSFVPYAFRYQKRLLNMDGCSRSQLLSVLGSPIYRLDCTNYEIAGSRPEFVEAYCRAGILYDICFFGDNFKVLSHDVWPFIRILWPWQTYDSRKGIRLFDCRLEDYPEIKEE